MACRDVRYVRDCLKPIFLISEPANDLNSIEKIQTQFPLLYFRKSPNLEHRRIWQRLAPNNYRFGCHPFLMKPCIWNQEIGKRKWKYNISQFKWRNCPNLFGLYAPFPNLSGLYLPLPNIFGSIPPHPRPHAPFPPTQHIRFIITRHWAYIYTAANYSAHIHSLSTRHNLWNTYHQWMGQPQRLGRIYGCPMSFFRELWNNSPTESNWPNGIQRRV